MICVVFWLHCALTQTPAADSLAEQELARLQGQWQSIETAETLRQIVYAPIHRLTLKDNKFIVLNTDGLEITSSFKIDPSTTPKAIDIVTPNGRKRIGVYKVERDTLTLCFGLDTRPKDFTITTDASTDVTIYKRLAK